MSTPVQRPSAAELEAQAAQLAQAMRRARAALGVALGVIAPEAIALQDGRVRLTNSADLLERDAMERLDTRLAELAARQVSDQRLVAEAVALLGAEVDHARGGSSPADGATAALDQLLDVPNLPQATETEAQAVLRNVLETNRLTTESATRRLAAERAAQRAADRPPLVADSVQAAQEIHREAQVLSHLAAPPATPVRRGGGHRQVGGRHGRTVGTRPEAGLTRDGRSRPNAAATNIFRRIRSAVNNFRGRDATAQYDEFRLLSRQWREELLRPTPDGERLGDLRQQLQGLANAIQRKRQPVPTLPWTTEVRHVIAPDRTQATQPATNTPAHLRERVEAEIAGLRKAVTALEERAEVKRTSATAATALAAKTITEAKTEEGRKDSAAPERGRKLRVTAASATAKAERHTTIADSCDAAVQQANEAIEAYQALLTRLDDVESGGQRPDQDVAVLAQTAADKVEAYRGGVAATLPSPEVQHAVITSGRLPHLTVLTRELNKALKAKKNPFRFTPEVLHRRLRAETRRMLAPDGVVITVGNDPRADVSELTQFKLHLRPGELSEVLASPITFDEGMLGQLEQGGYNLSTTATKTLTYNGGFGLKSVMAFFPDPTLLAVSHVVNPGLEYAVGQSHSVTSTATEYGLGGGVELLNGEILRYRSETPSWSWQMRTSAVADWSEQQVVDIGDPHDNSHLDVGVGHTYTVPPPGDTVTLEQLGLAAERETELPEHVASRVDGLNDMADEAIAGLAARLNGLDRVGHDQLRGLLIQDAPSRLDETSKPGGIGRLISKGGRPVAYAQLETFVELEEVELLSDSSPDHKIERLRVGFSGASGGQAFNANSATAATIGYGGTALNDLSNSTVDFGPTVKAGRNVSREDSLNVSDVAIHPSVQRTERTVGYKIHLRHRLTIHRLDKDESFTVDGKGDAVLRMPANAAFRYGLPIPKKELVLDADDRIQRGLDGRVLTKGDPQPTEEELKPPVWMGNGKGQLRGAGAALVQELKGADPAFKAFVRHLSDQGLVPPLDDKFRPQLEELRGKDPALVASQLENYERVGQQLARHRLETGYDLACQVGVEFALTKHRTGLPPQEHTFRIHLEQDVKRAKLLGLNTSQTATNLHIGSNTTVRARSRSKGLPWLARLGFSDKPEKNEAGSTPDAGPTYGRSALGRFFAWATGSTVNDVSLTESTAPLAEFEIPHKLTITEVFPDGDSAPIVEVDGSARVSIDSEFCDRGERQVVAMAGQVAPSILRTATWQHIDMGDPMPKILAQLPAAARTDSTARQHLNALLNSRNLCAHPELLTAQYGTGFAISPMPSNLEQAIAQRGLLPRQASVNLTARVENLRYVGSGHPVIGDINLTLGSSSFTAGSSTGQTMGVGGGSGAVETTGDGWNASAGLARASSKSTASTETTIGGVERLNIKDGQHYQFVGDLILVAEIKAAGLAEPQKIELPEGAIMLTMPERDALQHYGMNKDFHLPLEKVSDAVERLLDGNLSLDRRTTTALLRRYQQEKKGVTGGLADGHTTERLRDKLNEIVKVTKPDARPANFEQVAADAEQIAKDRVEARLPDHYRTTMGAALIAREEFVTAAGEETDMLTEVRAAIADRVPDALLDPAVAEALRSELGGKRWRGHIDDMLDPAGYTIDYPFGEQRLGTPPPRDLQVRIRIVYDGPPSTDGAKDDPTAGKTENNFNIVQGYDYTEEGRSATETLGYGANVGGELTQGDAGSAGLSTEASTSQTASSTEQNTRMSRALWQRTKSVERGFRLVIDVDEPSVVGADTKGVLRQKLAQRRQTDQKPPLRREAAGKLTLSVPLSDINPPDVVRPEKVDHRTVPLPNYYFLRGIQLHDADGRLPDEAQTVEDQNYDDELVKAACAGLGQRDMLTAAGVQMHKATLCKQLSAATRRIAFERADGEGSPWTTALPVPGHGSRAVSVRLRADLSGLQVISDPAAGDKGQLGEVNREQGITQTTTKSTKLLPTSKTIGGKDPVTGIKGGVSWGDQVTEKDTDTTGNRNETSSFESGELVTVELQVNFHLDVRRMKYDRHHQPTVTKERTIDNAASGVATLTMFRHELEAIQARMEAGLPPLQCWDPSRLAEATRRRPERRVSGHEAVRTDSGGEELHPYRPMVDALAQARRENVTVVLTMHQKDGTKQIYRAKPDGTMTGKDDNGFGAAFATLHPQLAVLAEGRVNLRELYDEGGHNGRFTGTVVKALQDKGIPASALTQLDHTLSAARANEAQAARPDGAKQQVSRNAAGKAGTGIGVQ